MATWVVCPRCVSWRFLPASEGGPSLCDSTAPWYNSGIWGVEHFPTADSGVTAHHRGTVSSCLLRGDDGLHRSPPATTAEAVVGETAFCEGRLSRLELYASEWSPYSSSLDNRP